MRVYAINASPRKKWNTATILQHALDGARDAAPDAQTEMIHLYDYKYKGCISCFQCKRLGSPSYGKCAVKDEITPVIDKLLEADVIIFGSPIYFGNVTGMLRSFEERLFFSNFVYDKNYSSLAPKKIHTAFAYTMNVPHAVMEEWNYPGQLKIMESCAERIFGHAPRILHVNNTYQFSDYSKYKMEIFSEEEKKKYREEQFPKNCENARKMGADLVRDAQ